MIGLKTIESILAALKGVWESQKLRANYVENHLEAKATICYNEAIKNAHVGKAGGWDECF